MSPYKIVNKQGIPLSMVSPNGITKLHFSSKNFYVFPTLKTAQQFIDETRERVGKIGELWIKKIKDN